MLDIWSLIAFRTILAGIRLGVFENLHNEPKIQEFVFSHHDGSKMDGPEFRYGLITRIPLLGRCHAADRSARGIIAIRFPSGQYVRLA